MTTSYDVVVLGSATIDYIEQHNRLKTKMGGVTTYAGLTFRQHGLTTAVVTNIAPQDDVLLKVFDDNRITCINGITEATTCFHNMLDGDHRTQRMPRCAAPITAAQAQPALQRTRHIHLGPLHPRAFDPGLLEWIRQQQAVVSTDIQGYVRRIENLEVKSGVSPMVESLLHCTTLLKGDDDELQPVLKYLKMDYPTLMQTFDIKEIIITAASKGGRVLLQDGTEIPYEPAEVETVVDTTGAGDVFFAAYLVARHHQSQQVSAACRHAAVVAARHIGGSYLPKDALVLSGVL